MIEELPKANKERFYEAQNVFSRDSKEILILSSYFIQDNTRVLECKK